jgi:REP element-mobilizing transposase RayT
VHFILYCSVENLERIVGNIKSVTSKKFKKRNNTNLWAQKFNRRVISNDKHLAYLMDYIKYNRVKHNLPENQRLQRLIEKMLTPYEDLFPS